MFFIRLFLELPASLVQFNPLVTGALSAHGDCTLTGLLVADLEWSQSCIAVGIHHPIPDSFSLLKSPQSFVATVETLSDDGLDGDSGDERVTFAGASG